MGLSGILARSAVRAAQVLVVEVPGHGATRMEVEHQLLRRGWRPAWTPADADVLAVCGAPGPELAGLVERLWEQMPGPRVRVDITSPAAVGSALDDAAALLLDTPHHRTDAQERAQEPEIPEDPDHGGHGGMDHGEMDHGEMDHGEMDHGEMDHGEMDHGEMDHGEMDHGEMDHGEMDHGEMDHGEMDHGEMDHGEMDHGEMDHGEMDHGEMDHGEMDHGEMDHGEMDHGEMDHGEMDHGEMDHGEMDHGEMDHGEMDHGEMDHGEMDHGEMDHGEMDHGEMDHGEMDHGEMDHGEMDHGEMDHGGHGGMDHSGHGGMDMAPEGIPLAEGGEDRDGLEMDVLHLPLGPVLPFWPAGLVLRCSLQGDVVVDADASVVDGADHPDHTAEDDDKDDGGDDGGDHGTGATAPHPGPAPAAVVRCDRTMALLALAGAEDAAACARRARDALLHGDQGAARAAAERLHRTVRRSPLLRWSLRGVLPLVPSDLEHHGLPRRCLGDAHDRLLSRVEQIRVETGGAEPAPVEDGAVPWAALPDLVTGLELASVRLAVASLDLDPHPAVREVGSV